MGSKWKRRRDRSMRKAGIVENKCNRCWQHSDPGREMTSGSPPDVSERGEVSQREDTKENWLHVRRKDEKLLFTPAVITHDHYMPQYHRRWQSENASDQQAWEKRFYQLNNNSSHNILYIIESATIIALSIIETGCECHTAQPKYSQQWTILWYLQTS